MNRRVVMLSWCVMAAFCFQECRAETQWQEDKFEVGTAQSGLYYVLSTSAGPWTAPSDNVGQYCQSQTMGSGTVSKYSLACAVLYGLFGLNANWNSQTVTFTSTKCEGCCTGPSCVIAKIYIHTVYTYKQLGWAVKQRYRTRPNAFTQWSDWSDWAYKTPCDSGYCVLYTRSSTGYSCAGTNQNETYDPALRTGTPGCP